MIRVLSFCLAAGMFVSGTASAGVILHEELSTDERPAQRLRPVHPGGQSESPLPPRPSIPTENLLDQMDIYALSPHAAALSLPRRYRQESCALFRQPHKPAVRCGYPSSRVTSR